ETPRLFAEGDRAEEPADRVPRLARCHKRADDCERPEAEEQCQHDREPRVHTETATHAEWVDSLGLHSQERAVGDRQRHGRGGEPPRERCGRLHRAAREVSTSALYAMPREARFGKTTTLGSLLRC